MLETIKRAIDVTSPSHPDDHTARLVRNLLALRTVLSMDQMQTGRWGDRIEEIDQELASLGHDMKSTAACAAEGLRRSFLLPRLMNRRTHHRSPSRRATKD
jgi:transposase